MVLAVAINLTCAQSVKAQAVPVISNVQPNGTLQFQPAAALTFNASSSAGIDPSGISVQLTGTSLPGQTFADTHFTTANGLIVSGTSTSRTVSAPLNSNTVYTAVINVIGLNSQSAGTTISFDTINPAYTFEAEDFDYGGGQFINVLQTNAYRNLAGVLDVDVHGSGGANAYRSDNPGLATENASDKPRQAYNTGLPDYDVGYNDGGSGKWGNYTLTFPAGVYNIYMRGSGRQRQRNGQRQHFFGHQRARNKHANHDKPWNIQRACHRWLAGL